MGAVREKLATALEPYVVARLGYIEPQRERPYDYAHEPPEGTPWQNYRSDPRALRIYDARRLPEPAIDREGFMLAHSASAVGDFYDEQTVKRVYYPEVAALARSAVGGTSAYVFDHLVRRRERGPVSTFGRRVSGERPSANGRVHNDYTEASGPRRMQQVLHNETHPHPNPPPEGPFGTPRAENNSEENQGFPPRPPFLASPPAITLLPLQGEGWDGGGFSRYAIVNVWRPIKGPVLDAPLALCSARSVSPQDLVVSDVHYRERTGEIYLATHSFSHRWFYFPQMQPNEALVFKQFDSDVGATRFVPHAAFDHPETPADAPLRESIEARVLVLF